MKSRKNLQICPKNETVSLSFLKTTKLENPKKIKYFRYTPAKLANLFLLKKLPVAYRRSSLLASNPIYNTQWHSAPLLELSQRLCRSVQKFTGVEKICLRLTSGQLLFLPTLKVYRTDLLKKLAFFQKNKELSKYFLEIFEGVPQAEISKTEMESGINIVSVLNEKTGFFKSNGDARRALTANSISVNKEKVTEAFVLSTKDLINNQFVLVQSGKKNYFVIRVK
jgi:hypothetical protein